MRNGKHLNFFSSAARKLEQFCFFFRTYIYGRSNRTIATGLFHCLFPPKSKLKRGRRKNIPGMGNWEEKDREKQKMEVIKRLKRRGNRILRTTIRANGRRTTHAASLWRGGGRRDLATSWSLWPPRGNVRCAAANSWWHLAAAGDTETLIYLVAKAENALQLSYIYVQLMVFLY